MHINAAGAAALVAVLALSSPALADSGSVTDAKGDYPDIVKLSYDNAKSKVTMTMKYAGSAAQNESFYMRWGSGKHYQVFLSPAADLKELRYASKKVACAKLVVTRPSSTTTKVVIPRTCLKKAPDKLRFQGIATEGLHSVDETKVSKAVARG